MIFPTHTSPTVKNFASNIGNGAPSALFHPSALTNPLSTAAAQKAGLTLKNGATAAKVGLQVLATASSVGSKVANFIPGFGTPVSAALQATGNLEQKASDAIPVNLGGQLSQDMSVMKQIENPTIGECPILLMPNRHLRLRLLHRWYIGCGAECYQARCGRNSGLPPRAFLTQESDNYFDLACEFTDLGATC
jgi:hypothetical protein